MEFSTLSFTEANDVLSKRLSSLKTETDYNKLELIAEDINGILYNAIEYYPTQANAVIINTRINTTTEGVGLPDSNTIFSGRISLENYLKHALDLNELSKEIQFRFVKHLPFTFTTGTHGSGERDARSASLENIAVETAVFKTDLPAYLMIDVADGGLCHRKAYLLPDEIKSIKLGWVDDKEFSQNLRGSFDTPVLEPSHSSAGHYLWYKGFGSYCMREEYVPAGKWKKGIVQIVGKVLTPKYSTKLLIQEYNTQFLNGFAALPSENGIILYEFKDVQLPKALLKNTNFGQAATQAAFAIALHQKKPQPNILTYSGKEIIDRLSQFKSERNF